MGGEDTVDSAEFDPFGHPPTSKGPEPVAGGAINWQKKHQIEAQRNASRVGHEDGDEENWADTLDRLGVGGHIR